MSNTTKETKKLKKRVEKLSTAEIEGRQRECLLQNATYSREVCELEESHSGLIRCRMAELAKKDGDRDSDRLMLIDRQVKAIEEEIERIEKLQKSNTEMVRVFQEVLASRIMGKTDKAKTILGWTTGISSAALAGLGLWFGYRRDVDGTMKNKTPIAFFERALGWLKIGK